MLDRELTILGNPIPKSRTRTQQGRIYTPWKTLKYEKIVRECATLYMRRTKLPILEGLVEIHIRMYRDSARGADYDNLAKSITDGCNGVLWKDDRQIKRAVLEVYIDRTNPRVELLYGELS